MVTKLRRSGIDILGEIPWGTHFCQFYDTKADLLEILLPYFKAGLDNNEFCFWITADPISLEEAFQAMKGYIPGFVKYLQFESIEIISYKDWYLKSDKFNGESIQDAWLKKLDKALARGFEGMRVNGIEAWLQQEDWKKFMQYENDLNGYIRNKPIIVLCTYPLTTSAAETLLDVAHVHESVISRRKGNWEILEEPDIKQIKASLVKMNHELDARVAERTQQLAHVIKELQHEIERRKKTEQELRQAYQRLSYHVDNTPLAVIEWDKDLVITRWSAQAESIFGWKASEAVGKYGLAPDFGLVYPEDIPDVLQLADELKNGHVDRNIGLDYRNCTKDGKLIHCEWYNSVLRDEKGNVITILSLAQDVTQRKNSEDKLNESYNQIRSLSEHLQIIREEERTHIAREIHDELGQHLTVLRMDVAWLGNKITVKDHTVEERLQDFSEVIDSALQSVKRIASALRPSLLDDLGLAAAMSWHLKEFEKHFGIKTFFAEPEELELPDTVKTGLFRVFQEALTNVARHSNASRVAITLTADPDQIFLSVEDNGIGFDPQKAAQKKTLGILGMKERAALIGGSYQIKAKPGKGTTVKVVVPVHEEGGSND